MHFWSIIYTIYISPIFTIRRILEFTIVKCISFILSLFKSNAINLSYLI